MGAGEFSRCCNTLATPQGRRPIYTLVVCSNDNLTTGQVEGMHTSHTTPQLTNRVGGALQRCVHTYIHVGECSVSCRVVQLHEQTKHYVHALGIYTLGNGVHYNTCWNSTVTIPKE